VERLFQSYQYGEAGRQIYEFFWNDFADWYVEIAKQQSDRPVTPYMLVHVLDICLRLLHPFTPFVTEELWGHLKQAVEGKSIHARFSPDTLMLAPWPETQPEAMWEAETIAQFTLVQDVVRAIRNLRAEKGVKPGKRISARIAAGEKLPILESQAKVIGTLAQLAGESLTLQKSVDERVGGDIALVVSGIEVYLPLADLVDTAPERARLEKELAGTENQVKRLEELLAGPFAQKAPPAVVQKERDKLVLLKETVSKLREQLSGSV
jgi:valyl-tRNA synthetase